MQDASDVMQLLLKTQTDFNDLEDDDPQVCLVLASNTYDIEKSALNCLVKSIMCNFLMC